MFKLKKTTKKVEIETPKKIETINLNNVVSIDVLSNKNVYNTRFFAGKKHHGINIQITLGLKQLNNIKESNNITLILNLINGDRYKQTAYVTKIEKQYISADLNEDIEKLEERRRSIKISSKLTGEFKVMNKCVCLDINNISLGGVFISTNIDLPLNSIILLSIKELKVCAKTVLLRQEKNQSGKIIGYGCYFEDLSERNQEKIAQHINSFLAKERQTLITRDVYNYF